jgi:hypothetical protein
MVCSTTPTLWYQLPLADVPLPGFQNCPCPTATATLDSQCTLCLLELHLELIHLDKPDDWRYNWATLFLGEIDTVTWPSRLGESKKWRK